MSRFWLYGAAHVFWLMKHATIVVVHETGGLCPECQMEFSHCSWCSQR